MHSGYQHFGWNLKRKKNGIRIATDMYINVGMTNFEEYMLLFIKFLE